MVKRGLQVILSNLGLFLRILLGNRLRFSWITLISIRATLKTRQGGIIKLGYKSSIHSNTEISATEGSVEIGDKCFINRNCLIASHQHIHIGNNTTIGPGVYIYDHDHNGLGGYNCQSIDIGDNVWIGAGCIILKGVKIGSNSVIGAGSLILKDIPENSVCYQKRSTVISERTL